MCFFYVLIKLKYLRPIIEYFFDKFKLYHKKSIEK